MPDRFVIPVPRCGPFVLGPDSQRQPDVPQGTVAKAEWRSTIFPWTVRDYYVYVPAQYRPDSPANVMVFQDGGSYVNGEGDTRVPVVFDNLIHQRRMPVTLGIFIDPGQIPGVTSSGHDGSQRSIYVDGHVASCLSVLGLPQLMYQPPLTLIVWPVI